MSKMSIFKLLRYSFSDTNDIGNLKISEGWADHFCHVHNYLPQIYVWQNNKTIINQEKATFSQSLRSTHALEQVVLVVSVKSSPT